MSLDIYSNQLSECCGAPIKWSDICSECGEHCEPQEDEEDENLGETGHGSNVDYEL